MMHRALNTIKATVALGYNCGVNQYKFKNLCNALTATMDVETRKSAITAQAAIIAVVNPRTTLILLTPKLSKTL
ncbi:MAG: hypothetical protein QXN03_01180, partial [Desulfurococcaceae archaeon]